VRSMGPAEAAVLLELQLLRGSLLVFRSSVVSLLTLGAGEGNNVSHYAFLLTSTQLQAYTIKTIR